jgi:hypothetical protein
MKPYVVIFLILMCVSACSRHIVVAPCAPIPAKTLITVEDFILRTIELEDYLNACLEQNAQTVKQDLM